MVGMFGSVSFAESATAVKPAVESVKAEAPAVAKKTGKKHIRKQSVARNVAAKKVTTPAAVK